MHTSSLVTAICTISLKAFFRFIQHEGNALNTARLTLLLIPSQFENCGSIQKSLNFCMDGKRGCFDFSNHNLYYIT